MFSLTGLMFFLQIRPKHSNTHLSHSKHTSHTSTYSHPKSVEDEDELDDSIKEELNQKAKGVGERGRIDDDDDVGDDGMDKDDASEPIEVSVGDKDDEDVNDNAATSTKGDDDGKQSCVT